MANIISHTHKREQAQPGSHDHYAAAVEATSSKLPLYIDPNEVAAYKKDEKGYDLNARVQLISSILDRQYNGISTYMTLGEKLYVFESSDKGASAYMPSGASGICIIVRPKGDEYSGQELLKTMGLSKFYSPAHLKDLPGVAKIWEELVGEHEGEHCNQRPVKVEDPQARLKTMGLEGESDFKVMQRLRAGGYNDVVQAWIDMRALKAAMGDDVHASGILITGNKFIKPTAAHLEAAELLPQVIVAAVANHLQIREGNAKFLMTDNPRAFAKALEDSLASGKFPGPRDMTNDEIYDAMSKKLGMKVKEIKEAGPDKQVAILAAYDAVKAETNLRTGIPDNPHLKAYINSYIGAVDRMFHTETPPPPIPPSEPEDELALASSIYQQEIEFEAGAQSSDFTNAMVGKQLGITPKEAADIPAGKYYKALIEAYEAGGTQFKTYRKMDDQEENKVIAKSLGITPDAVAEMADKDFIRYWTVYKNLSDQNMLRVLRDEENPELKKAVEVAVEKARKELAELEAIKAKYPDPEPDAEEDSAPEVEEEPTSSSSLPSGERNFMASLRSGSMSMLEMDMLSSAMTRTKSAPRPSLQTPAQELAEAKPKPALVPQETMTI